MRARAVCLALVLVAVAIPLAAQSLMYRPPSLGGTWVPDAGVVQFNFLHRFQVFGAPTHAVSNSPTFTFAAGLPSRIALGGRFATKSLVGTGVGARSTNETELFAKWRLFGGPEGSEGVSIAVTPAYNFLAKSADGELSVDWTKGPLTLLGTLRGMSQPFVDTSNARAAAGGGFVIRLTRYIGVSADVASFVSPSTLAAWGAAVNVVIPNSPHTFSLQVSDVVSSTIQGDSKGINRRLYGFEFTIPLHLKRFAPWFRRSPKAVAVGGPAGGAAAAEVRLAAFKFQTDSVAIPAGQTVRWTNDDPVEHSVTFDGVEPGSPLIPPRGTFTHRFDRPGTYSYHCTPHPFMKGVVVVK